jgi:hypothetical protein
VATTKLATKPEPAAVEQFRAEVREWAARMAVEPREIRVRPMTRKWASCSSGGRLTFSDALLGEPLSQRDEVIVHELLHLRVPNHGPLFRTQLRAYLARGDRAPGAL